MYSNNYTLKSKWEGLSFYSDAFVTWLSPAPWPRSPQKLQRENAWGGTGFALDSTQL